MKIKYNKTFKRLLSDYNINLSSDIDINMPKEVINILTDDIILDNKWIYWKENGPLSEEDYFDKNFCYDEKSDNHFHVDWYIQPMNSEQCFKLWIKTVLLLKEKLIKLRAKGIKITYSFHTPEMSKAHEESLWFNTQGEEYCIWDEISFYKIRKWPDLDNNFETDYRAFINIEL